MDDVRLPRSLLLVTLFVTPMTLAAQPDYEAREEQIRELMGRGELDSARTFLEAIIAEAPDRPAPYLYRAQITWMQGNDPIPDLARAIELDPGNKEAYATRADVYIRQKGYLSARGDARRAQELDTAWGYPYFLLAQIAAGRGDTVEAIRLMTDAIDHDWKDAQTYFERALLYATIGEFAKAEADLTTSIGLEPGVAAAYLNRSNVRYSLEDMDGACEDIGMALKLEKEDPRVIAWATGMQEKLCDSSRINYYVHRGIAAYNRGAFAEAIDHYNVGLREFPGSPMLRWTRGNAQVRLENWTEAEKEYRYALDSIDRYVRELTQTNMSGDMSRLAPPSGLTNAMTANLYLQIAEVMAVQGKRAEAYELIDRAIPYAPRGTDISIQLGLLRGNIAMEAGNREEAETFFRGTMREAPSNPAPALLLSALLLDEAIERSSGGSSSTTTISLGLTTGRSSRPLTARLPIASSTAPGTIDRTRVEEAISILTRIITLNPELGAAWYIRYRARHLIGAEGYCDDLWEAQRLEYPDALRGEEC